MEAGTLRHRLEIQAATEVRDEQGGVRFDWLPLRVDGRIQVVWGRVEPLRTRELLEAQKLEARISHRITLRYYPDFNWQWRLRLVNTLRVFNLLPARNIDERNRTLEVLAMEVLPGG